MCPGGEASAVAKKTSEQEKVTEARDPPLDRPTTSLAEACREASRRQRAEKLYLGGWNLLMYREATRPFLRKEPHPTMWNEIVNVFMGKQTV